MIDNLYQNNARFSKLKLFFSMHYITLSTVVEEDERGWKERERGREGEGAEGERGMERNYVIDPINRIVLQHN